MKNLLHNLDQTRTISIRYLKSKFSNTKLTTADFEDAVSTAFEKLLLDAAKPKPMLVASTQTICYLSQIALIDMYRKRKREFLTDEFSFMPPLSTTAIDDCFFDKKTRIEEVIAQVVYLPTRRRQLIEAKYDARCFDATTTYEDMIRFKNCTKKQNLTSAFGFPTEGAMRQEMFRAITNLRARLCA